MHPILRLEEPHMSLIQISKLSFSYGGSSLTIFDQVSFSLDTRWKLGLTGRNGRGKTTFLKILSGHLPFEGNILHNTSFEYFPYTVTDPNRLTYEVIETLYPNYEHWALIKEMNRIELSEDCLYRPFATLSSGEKTKFQLIILFLKPNLFLLIDEPTNHLDLKGRQAVGAYLNTKNGFILVSHDRAFLDLSVDHVLSINKNNITVHQGNFSTFLENKNRQDQFERLEHQKLENAIKTLKVAIKRTARWSDAVESSKFGRDVPDRGYVGHKAAKMMKRSKSIEKRHQRSVAEKEGLLKNIERHPPLVLIHEHPQNVRLITVDQLTVVYNDLPVCKPLCFSIDRGDRIALTGPNGSGKSTVIKALMGLLPYKGLIQYLPSLKKSYVNQETTHLEGTLADYVVENHLDDALFKSILHQLDVQAPLFDQPLQTLSLGQKKKILLARSLCDRAHIYLWDEPLNDLDLYARMQIEGMILAYKPTLLFVEHDMAFLSRIGTKSIQCDPPDKS